MTATQSGVPSANDRRVQLILHLSHTDVRCDPRILKELDALRRLSDCRVEAIGVARSRNDGQVFEGDGVRLHVIELWATALSRIPRPIKFASELIELLIRLLPTACLRKPSVVHCHDTLVLPIGWLVKCVTGCKLVYDAHELESQKAGQTWLLSMGTLSLERLCWRWIDLLVSVSRPIVEWYVEELGTKRSVVVMNSPQISAASSTNRADAGYFHRRFGVSRERKVFLHSGNLAVGRSIPLLLRVFGHPGYPHDLVFLGSRDIIGAIDMARGLPNVHFHPAVPHDELVALAGTADFGVCLFEDRCLSMRYALPNKLFEYAFAGLPVLASDLPEIGRVVREYRLGVCCSPTADDVAQAIDRLVDGEFAVDASALAELGWDRQAERLRGAYRKLLDHHRCGRSCRSRSEVL